MVNSDFGQLACWGGISEHPPFHYTDYSHLPCSVVWLREQKDNATAIDYPVGYDFGEVQIWQTFHHHPLFNGAFEWQKTVAVWQEIWDLTKIGVGKKLKDLGIKYAVVHTQDFLYGGWHPVAGSREGSFSQKLKLTGKEGLKLVKSCPEAEILEVL